MYKRQLIIVLYTKRNDPKDSSELNKNLIDLINLVYKSLFENAKIGMKTDEIQASNKSSKEATPRSEGSFGSSIKSSEEATPRSEGSFGSSNGQGDEYSVQSEGSFGSSIRQSNKDSVQSNASFGSSNGQGDEYSVQSEGSFGSWIGQGDKDSVQSNASFRSLGQSTASSADSKVTVDERQMRELVAKARDPNR